MARERNGKALTIAFRSEAMETNEAGMLPGSVGHADEAKDWDRLHKSFTAHRINHQESYSDGEACTNQAESYVARLRRSEMGVHHRMAGLYPAAYVREMAWHENFRRVSNGTQYALLAGASLNHPHSLTWWAIPSVICAMGGALWSLSQIVHALTEKRNEIEAHIRELRRQFVVAEMDLSSVTAVLALPELSPASQARFPAYAQLNRLFAYGEMFKLCKTAIEEAGKPLDAREVARAIIRAKGLNENDAMLRKAVAYRLIENLARAAMQGRIGNAGKRKGVRVRCLPWPRSTFVLALVGPGEPRGARRESKGKLPRFERETTASGLPIEESSVQRLTRP